LVGRRFISDVEHFLARADLPLRLAMAVKAPFHQERGHLVGERHFVDAPMARGATDALLLSLKTELPRLPSGIQDAATNFQLQAENCSLWLLEHPSGDLTNRDVRAMMDSWALLKGELEQIDRAEAPASLEQADRLDKNVEQIRSQLHRMRYG
jgi:hypothetical protein